MADPTAVIPTPEHRVLDRTTAILLELALLRRQLDEAGLLASESYAAMLDRMTADVQQLAETIAAMRPAPERATNLAVTPR